MDTWSVYKAVYSSARPPTGPRPSALRAASVHASWCQRHTSIMLAWHTLKAFKSMTYSPTDNWYKISYNGKNQGIYWSKSDHLKRTPQSVYDFYTPPSNPITFPTHFPYSPSVFYHNLYPTFGEKLSVEDSSLKPHSRQDPLHPLGWNELAKTSFHVRVLRTWRLPLVRSTRVSSNCSPPYRTAKLGLLFIEDLIFTPPLKVRGE